MAGGPTTKDGFNTTTLKLGAQQEGILRHNRILPDGYLRNTVVFSILEAEWPAVRQGLDARLATWKTPA